MNSAIVHFLLLSSVYIGYAFACTKTYAPNYNYPASTVNASADPVVTSWLPGVWSSKYTAFLNVKKVQYSATYAYVSCSGLPTYSVGPYTGNPNTESNQEYTFQFPRVPTPNSGTKTAVTTSTIGVLINGVPLYNADDAQTINGWKRNAFYFEGSSFDSCLGHPQQSGAYHHHVRPICLFNSTDSSKHSPLLGFANDGYPIYGAFGYSTANVSTSGIKRMVSSYRTRTFASGTRDTKADGTVSSGPSISTYPIGAFMDDFEYVSGLGDLDANNGRLCVTPEYPSGTYAYFLTADANNTATYPYTLGAYYYGYTVAANVDGKITPSETVTLYYTADSVMIRSSMLACVFALLVFFCNYLY